MKGIGLILVALLIAGSPAFADVVHLKSGGTIEGKVTDLGDEVKIEGRLGASTLKKWQIKEIETRKTAIEVYEEKSAAVKSDDSDAHYELGLWCQENKLDGAANEEFEKAIELTPDHEAAHVALGHVFFEGEWMTEPQMMNAKGYVKFHGDWITREEYELRLNEDEQQAKYDKGMKELKRQIKRLSSKSEKTRDRAFERATEVVQDSDLDPAILGWLSDARDHMNIYWSQVAELELVRRRALIETRASMGSLREMRQLTTQMGPNGPTATIELPHLEYAGYQGTVLVPAGR